MLKSLIIVIDLIKYLPGYIPSNPLPNHLHLKIVLISINLNTTLGDILSNLSVKLCLGFFHVLIVYSIVLI